MLYCIQVISRYIFIGMHSVINRCYLTNYITTFITSARRLIYYIHYSHGVVCLWWCGGGGGGCVWGVCGGVGWGGYGVWSLFSKNKNSTGHLKNDNIKIVSGIHVDLVLHRK